MQAQKGVSEISIATHFFDNRQSSFQKKVEKNSQKKKEFSKASQKKPYTLHFQKTLFDQTDVLGIQATQGA